MSDHPDQEGAYADVTVKLGLIKLLHKQFDVCEEAYVYIGDIRQLYLLIIEDSRNANASVRCPVEKGYYEVEQMVTLPKEIPQGECFADLVFLHMLSHV